MFIIINQLKTLILLSTLMGLMLGVGFLLGGQTGLFIALIFSLIMNFGVYWFSDRIVLAMYRAKEANKDEYKELHKMVGEVSKLSNIPKPKVYIINSDNLNAFATGRSPNHAAIAFTTGILKALSKEELKGVTAHEISHVRNRDTLITTVAATIAGVISYIATMAQWAAIFGGRDEEGQNIVGVLVLALITPIIATLIQLAISRAREYMADETGAKTIKNPNALADALQKLENGNKHNPMRGGSAATSSLFIVNPFSSNAIVSMLSTHPPIEKRVQRLRGMRV